MRPPGYARLEPYRIARGPWASDRRKMDGAYLIPRRKVELRIIACDGTDPEAQGWEHVSVSLAHRTPTWEEMEFVRDLFWLPEDTVLQFSVPREQHINAHPFCLHMWRKIGATVELPPPILVAPNPEVKP